jgi:hypothetical protein
LVVGRLLGVALLVFGLLCGAAILYGSHSGTFAAGLLRTWSAFGLCTVGGLVIASLSSGAAGSERLVRNAGLAVLGLGALAALTLVLSKRGALVMADTMQPWALVAVCAIVGGVILFGSRA